MDSKSFDIPRCVENIFCCLCMDEQQNISSLFFKIEVAGHDQHDVVGHVETIKWRKCPLYILQDWKHESCKRKENRQENVIQSLPCSKKIKNKKMFCVRSFKVFDRRSVGFKWEKVKRRNDIVNSFFCLQLELEFSVVDEKSLQKCTFTHACFSWRFFFGKTILLLRNYKKIHHKKLICEITQILKHIVQRILKICGKSSKIWHTMTFCACVVKWSG
jgi:hypothetical protein